jgi:acetoacetyl-CoA reductase
MNALVFLPFLDRKKQLCGQKNIGDGDDMDNVLTENFKTGTEKNGKPVAVVTGGTRGIGRAIVEELVNDDFHVVVTYRSSEDAAEKLRNILKGKVTVKRADVSKKDEVDELFNEILEKYGRVDVLVNNAGITQDRSFHKMLEDEWKHVIDVNLNGAFYCCTRAINTMRDQKYGRIVNISSIVGQKGNFGQANYAASKAGVLGLTKTLALENAMKGITVNAVCPGFIETDMVEAIPEDAKVKIKSEIPMQRFGQAKEVAKAVKFLVSRDSAYITGQELNVNGGLLTH